MNTIGLFIRVMGLAPFLVVFAIGLRFACFLRTERLWNMGRLCAWLGTLCLVDAVFAVVRLYATARPSVLVGIESWLTAAQGLDTLFKVGTAVLCLRWARVHSSTLVIAVGLGVAVLGDAVRHFDGVLARDTMLDEILAWLIVHWGLGRVGHEVRAMTFRETPEPLWRQFEAARAGNREVAE